MSIFQVNEEHVKDVFRDVGSPSGLSILSVDTEKQCAGRPLTEPQERASQQANGHTNLNEENDLQQKPIWC